MGKVLTMFNKVRRKFSWKPVKERKYHYSFKSCIHHWNWESYGQCPQCARGALMGINWSLVDEKTLENLGGIIKAASKEDSNG